MGKKKYTNNKLNRESVIQSMIEANPHIDETELRYVLENEVSTPNITFDSNSYGYLINPALFEMKEDGLDSSLFSKSWNSRQKEIEDYGNEIPYIKDKEIRLKKGRFNTGKISTNLLDSIYDSAKRVGIPFKTALALAGRESTLGIGRGFKEGQSISPTALFSNWQQVQTVVNPNSTIDEYNKLMKEWNKREFTQDELDFISKVFNNEKRELESTKPITENPIDNALKYYMTGNYNSHPNYNKLLQEDAQTLMSDPAIQKWLETKKAMGGRIRRANKYNLGSWIRGLNDKWFGKNEETGEYNSDFGETLANLGFNANNIGGIANTAVTAINGLYNPNGNSTKVGNAMQSIGGVVSNIPGVGGIAGAALTAAGGVVNAAFGSNLNEEKIAEVEGDINKLASFNSNAGDYDALAANYANNPVMANFSKKDIGTDGWFSNKAGEVLADLQEKKARAEDWVTRSLSNNADNIASSTQQLLEANYTAYGGPLFMRNTGAVSPFGNRFDMGGFTNNVTTINEGGSHESNPFEGVQMGVDPQGIPNLVEEGEVIFNDYVFSKRLKVPKAVRQKYRLRGITFADAAEQLQKESEERPNDPISKNGLEASMNRLMQEQEMVRVKSESNKYAHGGKLGNLFDGPGNISNMIRTNENASQRDYWNALMGTQLKARLKSLIDKKASKEEIEAFMNQANSLQDSYGTDILNSGVTWGGKAKSGAGKKHQEAWNTAGYNNYTDYGNWFGNRNNTGDRANTWVDNNIGDLTLLRNLGDSKVLSTEDIGEIADLARQLGMDYRQGKDGLLRFRNSEGFDIPELDIFSSTRPKAEVKDLGPIDVTETVEESPLPSTKIDPIKYSPLRYAPIVGAGINVINDLFRDTDYGNADLIFGSDVSPAFVRHTPVGQKLAYRPFDRDFYINKLNANTAAGRRAVANTSGGNRAAALAGILATDYNYGNQLGDLARQAEEYNLAQRQKVADFNRATDMFNAQQSLQAQTTNANNIMQARQLGLNKNMAYAKMRQAILDQDNAVRANNWTNLLEGVAGLGKENTAFDAIRYLTDKGVLRGNAYGGRIKRKKGITV